MSALASTDQATDEIAVRRMRATQTGCDQCHRDATHYVETGLGYFRLCRIHTGMALDHYATAVHSR